MNKDIDRWISRKVNQVIHDDGFKVKAIAEKIGMPVSTFTSKRRAYSSFTFPEIEALAIATNHDPREFLPPEFTNPKTTVATVPALAGSQSNSDKGDKS